MSAAAVGALFAKFLLNSKQMKMFSKGMGAAQKFAEKAKDMIGVQESGQKLLSAFDVLKVPLKLITADFIGPIMESNLNLMKEMIVATKDPAFQVALGVINKLMTNFIDGVAWIVKLNNETTSAFDLVFKFYGLLKDINLIVPAVNLNLGGLIAQIARLVGGEVATTTTNVDIVVPVGGANMPTAYFIATDSEEDT